LSFAASYSPAASKEAGRSGKLTSSKVKKLTEVSADVADEDIAELKKRVKALEQENKRLKKKRESRTQEQLRQTTKSSDLHDESDKRAGQPLGSSGVLPSDPSMAGLSNRQRNKLALRAKREERKLRKAEARAKREAQQQHQQQLQQALTVEQVVDDKTLTQMCGNKATVADTSAWRPFSLQPSIERALITKVADISTDH
jgi:hypothetical protein